MANKRINKKQNERVRAAKATTTNKEKVVIVPEVEKPSSDEEKVDVKKVENEGNTIGIAVEEASTTNINKNDEVVYSTDKEYKNDSLSSALREAGIDLVPHFQTVEVDTVEVGINVSPEEEEVVFASDSSSSEIDSISEHIDCIIASENDEDEEKDTEPYEESFEEKVTNKILNMLSKKDLKRVNMIVEALSDNKPLSDKAEELLLHVKDGMTEEELRVLYTELNQFCESLEEAMKASDELDYPRFFVTVNRVLNLIPQVMEEMTGINLNARVVIKKVNTTNSSPEKEKVDVKKTENEGNTIGVAVEEASTTTKDKETSNVKEETKTSETKGASTSESTTSDAKEKVADDEDEGLEIIFIDDLDEEKFKAWEKPLFVKTVQEYWRTGRNSREWCKDVQRCHTFNVEHGFEVQLI